MKYGIYMLVSFLAEYTLLELLFKFLTWGEGEQNKNDFKIRKFNYVKLMGG
jgi:hypothetical protein